MPVVDFSSSICSASRTESKSELHTISYLVSRHLVFFSGPVLPVAYMGMKLGSHGSEYEITVFWDALIALMAEDGQLDMKLDLVL
jgi:hypothetical protein